MLCVIVSPVKNTIIILVVYTAAGYVAVLCVCKVLGRRFWEIKSDFWGKI